MVNIVKVADVIGDSVAFVDVRTPKEYNESHIPDAVNRAILSNEERHIIGILYKQAGKDVAIAKGEEVFKPRAEEYIEGFSSFKNKKVVVYCARGGMRSKVITELLEARGFNVYQMDGGYKAYRNYVLDRFKSYKLKCKFVVIHGLTGVGKSEIIRAITVPKIDIEDIAQHRSSLFGSVGLQPRSQKMFENTLLFELDKVNVEQKVLIEGESRKVGDCIIPEFLFKAMGKGVHVLVESSIGKRVERTVAEYSDIPEKIEQSRKVIPQLKQALGGAIVQKLLKLLDAGDYKKVAEIILLKYYDPRYSHTLAQYKYEYTVRNDEFSKAIKKIKTIISS